MSFTISRASAGSGKTFKLVKEYLRIALSSDRVDNYRGILAITFTNKAAEEMKSRVIAGLGSIVLRNPDDAMTAILVKETGIPVETLAVRAERARKHMLHHYADISISTIDHFTHQIIRIFAQDLELPVNFEVALETDDLTIEITDRLLMLVGHEPTITDALKELVRSQVDEDRSWSLDDQLRKMAQVVFSEESRSHLGRMEQVKLSEFNRLRLKLRKKLRETESVLVTIGTDFNKGLAKRGLAAQDLAGGKNGIFNFFNKLSDRKFDAPTATVVKNIEADKWHSSKCKPDEKVAIDDWKQELELNYGKAIALIGPLAYYQLVFNQIYGTALLDEMYGILKQIQEENDLLHISEFNNVINNVVMNESAPFIYERIGCRYHHFLVDEFQDTSVLQWYNLLPLISESLAHDNLCLVVGDAKQSIYRWRGGDVQQFVELPAIHRPSYMVERIEEDPSLKRLMGEWGTKLSEKVVYDPNPVNFRSATAIVDFNSDLFTDLQSRMPEDFKGMYDSCGQTPNRKDEGMVSLRFFRQEDSARSWPEYDQLTFEQIKEWIGQCKDDGYQSGDIAIVVRRNLDAVKVAQYLIEEGLDVASSESLLINGSPKVRLLVNLAVRLIDPSNSLNSAELIQHLGMVRNEQELTSQRLMVSGQSDHFFQSNALLTRLYPNINWAQLRAEPLYGLFDRLVYGLFPNDTESHLRFFKDEVLEFYQDKGNDLRGFISHWTENRAKLSISLTEDSSAIRIISIHKSKGLEFPVVIHPFADYEDSSTRNSIWVRTDDQELQPLDRFRVKATKSLLNTPFESDLEHEQALTSMDMYNMMYVALTRPKERLYICGKLKKETTKDQTPSTAVQYIYDHLAGSDPAIASDLCFSVGSPSKRKPADSTGRTLKLKRTGDPFWMQRISISRPSVNQWERGTDEKGPRYYGILVHDAMAHIRTAADLDAAVQMLVEDGRISNKDISELKQKLARLLSQPELLPLFADDMMVRNEADIQLKGGQWLRPDRVVTKNEKAWVIDYKTGSEHSKHHQQVESYMRALNELGFQKVNGLLVYIDQQKIVQV